MIVRLLGKCRTGSYRDYDLVDVLRCLSVQSAANVIGRTWLIVDLDLHAYYGGGFGPLAITAMFPGAALKIDGSQATVDGERLLQGAALIHHVESGIFIRAIRSAEPVLLRPDYRLSGGPLEPQATNADLEIRCDESGPFEVVTADDDVCEHLRASFAATEVIL